MTTRKRPTNSPQMQSHKAADPHQQLALEHSAMHTARMGIARWTSGISTTQLDIAAALMPTSQVQWHKKAQKDFQAWLEAGGFAAPPMATVVAATETAPDAAEADATAADIARGPVYVG